MEKIMYTELNTSDIVSIQKFIGDHAEQRETHQFHLRKKNGMFCAELIKGDESAI
jgi:hypothetical protein